VVVAEDVEDRDTNGMFNPNEAFFLQWHITDQCNFSCTHCYRDSVKSNLNLPQLKLIFENFQRLRVSMPQKKARVQIAGGEPLLSEHIFPILDLIATAGFQSRILTNGSLIDAKVAKEIKEHGCNIVQISIDGSISTHDAIRGQGNFERAIEGARFLREHDIQVTFAMTLLHQNMSEVGSVFETAKQAAQRVSFHRLVPCGQGVNLKDQLLGKEDIKNVFKEIWKLKNSNSNLEVPLRDPLWKPFVRCLNAEPYVDGCSIGYGGISIDSNGDVYPCRRMPVRIGNALLDELTDIWHSPLMTQLRNRDLLKGRCGACSMRWKCGGCRAIGWAVNGDMFAEDPQCFCKLSIGEKVSYKLINRLNRNAYLDNYAAGG
jgi:radical SAM protein with 4Fe4S-binding SPASM domain